MQHLWAPWRMKYVQSAGAGACFFCRALREKKDRENLLLLRGERCLVMLNRYPYNPGHLMVAPKRHTGKLSTLTSTEVLELHTLTSLMVSTLQTTMRTHGYNIGINLGRSAGAGVPGHVHQHIVPRWKGDTNFMPVVAETKVVPIALEKLYDNLRRRLRGLIE